MMRNFWRVFCVTLFLLAFTASGHVVLIGKHVNLSFDDIEANFSPSVKGSGISGKLYLAKPLDACSLLVNEVDMRKNSSNAPFVLIMRGGCSFEDKVRRAQAAGFKAAIVYDNEYGALVAMAGNSGGIKIAAVFVSKTSGETLAKYAGIADIEIWIIPSFENSAWSIMAISFISLLAMSAMLATCFFVRRHRTRRSVRASRVREFHGMSRRLVKAMPSLIFTSVLEDNCTSRTCAVCLEDYNVGDKLRILPCHHKFHATCVDAWLTSWRTFCPVCKRDARTSTGDPPASESTPLLSSSPVSVPSSSAPSSVRSSLAASSAISISAASYRSPPVSRPQSISSTPYNQQYLPSCNRSSHLTGSQSSVDLRNASSQRSHASYLTSSNSLRYPVISPLNTRHLSAYIPSPGNASSSFIGSSSQLPRPLHYSESTSSFSIGSTSQHPRPLHYSESTASFSPFASAQSLPGC